jgi:hypothetical protein
MQSTTPEHPVSLPLEPLPPEPLLPLGWGWLSPEPLPLELLLSLALLLPPPVPLPPLDLVLLPPKKLLSLELLLSLGALVSLPTEPLPLLGFCCGVGPASTLLLFHVTQQSISPEHLVSFLPELLLLDLLLSLDLLSLPTELLLSLDLVSLPIEPLPLLDLVLPSPEPLSLELLLLDPLPPLDLVLLPPEPLLLLGDLALLSSPGLLLLVPLLTSNLDDGVLGSVSRFEAGCKAESRSCTAGSR